jgi:hypothetical protein
MLADLAYILFDRSGRCITGFKKARNSVLTQEQKDFNSMLSWYHATVEHLIAFIKHWRILGGRFRGKPFSQSSFLADVVAVLINFAAFHIRRIPLRVHFNVDGVAVALPADRLSKASL